MDESIKQKNKRIIVALLLMLLCMVGVGVALIPLYDVFTKASGVNGKLALSVQSKTLNYQVDKRRLVDLELLTAVGKDTPLRFNAVTSKLQVNPGQAYLVDYTVTNTASGSVNARANASVSPGLSIPYFKLFECFCMENQQFAANETKQVQLRFAIAPQMPVETKSIVLALQYFKTK